MLKKWLAWVNLFIGGAASALLLTAFLMTILRPDEIDLGREVLTKPALPRGAFAMSKEACDMIGKTALELKCYPMTVQLPDLRKHLVYYGKNGRPDAQKDRAVLHFAFTGNATLSSVSGQEPLYILYDRQQNPPQYIFSPGNAPTLIWIEANSQGNEAIVKVSMQNEAGEVVREPASRAQFNLGEKEYAKAAGRVWELGKWRVDGSLLARQKARWVGQDLFLDRHGGEEFSFLQGKQRIDFFDENEAVYSIFVKIDDCLIWENNRWQVVTAGEETLAHPLLIVKKVDERLMNFELWDADGKGKMSLNLIRMIEPWTAKNLEQSFKFVGARTRSQYIFEVDKERIFVSPQDWLLLTEDGWVKLSTTQDIDDYVERKLKGVLFILDNVERKDDRQVFAGTIFNENRTEFKSVELAVQQNNMRAGSMPESDDFDDEDEDDDDDEDRDRNGKFIAVPASRR